LKRSGASHFARFCLHVFSALLLAMPVLAEDKPQPRGLREGVTFISSAAVVEVHERGGETAVVLLGDAHILIEIEAQADHATKPGEAAHEKQLIDLRAENAVVYVPIRPADLRGGTVVRGFPFLLDRLPMRALYAEGNVRLEQRLLNGKGKRALEGPSVLEASQIYLDVVSERIYAQDASARLSAGPKRLPSAGTSTAAKGPSQEAAFTLRAESMRIRGA
jgi:hypothetical protein